MAELLILACIVGLLLIPKWPPVGPKDSPYNRYLAAHKSGKSLLVPDRPRERSFDAPPSDYRKSGGLRPDN